MRLHGSDLLVHKWLGETWLIDFVVAVESEANHIDQDVFLVLVPVTDHELAALYNCLDVRGIHAENGHTERLHNVSGILERTVVFRRGREANLVIRDDVDAAITVEFGQLCQG